MKLKDVADLSYSEWEELIDEWIFSERDRNVLKSTMLDGYSYEQTAEMLGMSARQIARIMPALQTQLFKHIKKS